MRQFILVFGRLHHRYFEHYVVGNFLADNLSSIFPTATPIHRGKLLLQTFGHISP